MRRWLRILLRPWRRAYLEETAFVAETVRRLSVPYAAPGITREHVIAARWHLRRVEQSFVNHHRLAGWQMRVAYYPYQPVSPEAP